QQGGHNVYNIEGQKFSGSTQFRHYDKFNLTEGDIANLIYKNGYDKFINLVNNQVNINGLVNTMRDNNFFNGHAIFVSPNGVVVGASGVLNVGALSLITPNQSSYNSFLEKYNANNLSAYEFGAEKYKSLLTASNGNITINGRVLSRGDVNLYGKNIKIEGASNSHAGIIAGWKDNNTVVSDSNTGKALFDTLVSHNITDGTHFDLQNGKIIISAQSDSAADINIKNSDLVSPVSADIISTVKYSEQERRDKIKSEINIENSKISLKDVNIGAVAANEKIISTLSLDSIKFIKNMLVDIFTKDFVVTTLWGTSGGAEAKVTIKDAVIQAANNASIYADANSKTEQNINLLTPTAILLLKDAIVGKDGSIDTTQRANAKLAEYFSTGLFNGFEGPRTSAVVTLQNSNINAGNDLNIGSNANSSLTATSNLLAQVLPIGMYGVGTSTESKTIIQDSVLNSTRDTTIEAMSLNTNKIVMKSDSLFSMPIEDGAFAILLNNTTKTNTEVKVNNSAVTARDLNVGAVNLSNSDVKLEMVAKVDKNVQQQGDSPNSAISLVAILNRSQNNVTAEVNNSDVNTDRDVNVVAQSLNTTKNSASGKIQDDTAAPPQTVFSDTQKKLKAFQTTYLNRSLFSRVKGKTDIEATGSSLVQAGGALVWNKTENNTNAKITNSSINATNDVNVQANTIDLTANSALTDSNGKAKVGVGLGVIVNEEKNNTNAIIDSSDIEADNLDVYATTELPMNQGSITFGVKFPFKIFGVDNLQFGGKFVSEANAKWDLSFVHPLQDASFSSDVDFTGVGDQNITSAVTDAIAPKFRLTGFFNNFAQTTSKAEGVDVSASVVYNEVVNNTLANIKNNSEIILDGDLRINAVNSVIGYNAAGMIDFLINKLNYKIPGQPDYEYRPQMDSDTFGMGANVIWDIYNNNASAKIENSEVTAQNGDVNVTSANEQAYITAIATGARSKSIGIDGSINVQNLKGNTESIISNNSDINAQNVNVNAGAAKVATSGGKIQIDETTNRAKLNDEREANDQITNIIATGAWVSQYKEIDNKVQESSEGVAIGADVNYTTIERNIKALVDNSTITAIQNAIINSDTYSQTLNLAVAAAFTGGVVQKNADISKADKGVDKAKNDNNPHDMFGNLFANEDEYMKNPVGNALAPFSLSAAGALTVNLDSTNVESNVSKSTVNVGSDLEVLSNKESRIINMAGGLGKSKKVGAGAALNFYRQNGKISSKIDDSTINFTKDNAVLNVNADNTNKIVDIAIGAGAGTNTQAEAKGFRGAAGGSYIRNTITPTIEAIINNSSVGSTEAANLLTANVKANSQLTILDIAGGGAYLNGGTYGIGAGFAVNYNDINNTINALVQNSSLTNIYDLSVTSLAQNNFTNVAVAAAMVSGTSSGYLFNGALNLDFIHNVMSSKIVNSDIQAAEDVNVSATSNTDNTNVAGTLNVSTANTGFGVNGDVIVNVQKNNITAEINNDNTNEISANNVAVQAVSNETSSSTPIGAAVSSQNTMAAANIALNIISNSINSQVKGKINTENNLDVTAFDETTLRSRGITVALTGPEALAVLGGTINYDILNKTVNAKIYDSDITANDVNVNATSINSLGGTKNEQGKYDRDNFSDDNYNEKLLAKNDKGEYTGLKQDANFTNWNMFYDVSAGANLAFAGAWIIKNVRNDIEAQVTNSVIGAKNLDVTAQDYSIKNIISGAISASGQVGIGASVLITKDNSNVYSLITNGSELDIENTLKVNAKNTKDNIQVLVALGGGGTGYAGINVAKNDNTDKTVAKIDKLKTDEPVLPQNPTSAQTAEYNTKKQQWDNAENVNIKAAQTSVNAQSDQNSTHVIVAGGGAGTVALAINPAINTYKSETTAGILNATVENASIGVNANNDAKTRDIQAGVAGSGVVAGVGLVVINDYADNVKSLIDKSVINTTKDISVLANSSLYSLNVLASVGVAIEGVSVVANVVKNHIVNETEAAIKNSTILNAGNIEVLANKNKQDKITNVSGGVSVAATGMSATTGNIFNIYKNKTTADVISTAIDQAASLDVEAYSNKVMTNRNVGVSAGIIGAGLLVDTLDNKLDSTTVALIDAKKQQMFLTDDVTVFANDKMQSSNTMVSVYGGAGFAGANVNFFDSDNLVKAQILSDTEGLISAKNVNINSSSEFAIGNTNVGVSLGIGGIAGDVFGLNLGKRSDKYSTSEEKSNVNKAKDEAKNLYDKTTQNGTNYYTPTTSSDSLKTGTIASSDANIYASENVSIDAKSQLKGIDSDTLSLKNVNTSAGIGAIGVGVKTVKLNNNTLAEVKGGKINATGDVGLNSESKNKVEIVNTDVNVAGISVAGSSATYANSSDTTSKIENAIISADDINVISNSNSKADLTGTSVLVSGVSAGISITEATDTN
nr:leukotoxin LktA family filamentous adhesin [Candidatus Gastranaerophilales bacterium]